ncbi:MAG TPA: polyphosphate kinase 2 family protein [Propionibacterium sp.]|nr:polyphosphate kinase 2 family protein [Propionibacterium sp.]
MAAKDLWTTDPRIELRAGPDFDLAELDRNGQPGWEGDKDDGEAYLPERGEEMSELQERLYAEGRDDGTRSVLLILQGLDTAGKGGIVRHVVGMVDPQGVALASFGVPTEEELSHHYLWRIEKELPPAGRIGVFDRSHYEDVLVVRVDELVPEEVWRERYDEINAWEKKVVEGGTTIIKVALMVSYAEQGERLMERLERPDKYWKFNPGDIDTRSKWPAFQEAYADVFRLTSTDHAPWYVVPADKKWYSRLAVTEILTRTLEEMDLGWPEADFDVEEMRKALDALEESHR